MNSSNTKCTELVHQKALDLFCRDCKCVFCVKCVDKHHHHRIIDSDDYYNDIIEQSQAIEDRLVQQIQGFTIEKEDNQKFFHNEVESHYQSQLDQISNLFRKLHDQLHYKEIEIKRELKSYHDDNTETLATLLSKIDSEILKCNNTIDLLSSLKSNSQQQQQPQQPQPNQQSQTIYNDKISVIKNYNDSSNIRESDDDVPGSSNQRVNKYQLAMIKEMEFNNVLDSIETFGFKVRSIGLKKNGAVTTTVYRYNEKGIERISLETGDIQLMTPYLPPNCLDFPSFYWKANSHQDVVYMFCPGHCVYLDTKCDNPQWKTLTHIPIGIKFISSVSDPNTGNLYIVGGYNQRGIFRISQPNQEFKKIGELKEECGLLSLSICGAYIYIVGGQTTNEVNQQRIDRFNIETNQLDTISDQIPFAKGFINSCYVPKLNSMFIITSLSQFLRFDIESQQTTTLTMDPMIFPGFNASLFYDNDDKIFCTVQDHNKIFTYSIKSNQWSRTIANLLPSVNPLHGQYNHHHQHHNNQHHH
ncbi:hypothetical protein DLAC_11667 [Tieghemostelium lacteum]|uniref:B box-type domain-containing protein n=1 Tax=Tieghemostelium lacteum TaxID=361077 RepID=A0A151ZFV8_TIELA|nr:hypothetical protein DLAC_11667 [Tieghemostelium lacteum]|eukprot:KYQ92750.1 hypothetical protein DLAC_11667 [Tieghemostelium lacteum]